MPRRMPLIGERRYPVAIEQASDTVDTSGFPTQAWTELEDVVLMSREDVSGTERLTALQVSAPYETRWVMPYQEAMDPEVIDVPKVRRLVYRGRTHDIVRAEITEDRAAIELLTLARSQPS